MSRSIEDRKTETDVRFRDGCPIFHPEEIDPRGRLPFCSARSRSRRSSGPRGMPASGCTLSTDGPAAHESGSDRLCALCTNRDRALVAVLVPDADVELHRYGQTSGMLQVSSKPYLYRIPPKDRNQPESRPSRVRLTGAAQRERMYAHPRRERLGKVTNSKRWPR